MVGTGRARWRGTAAESQELEAVLDRYCTCAYPRCAVHEMLQHEQRALDGLLFVRRMLRPRLLVAEFSARG